jgi:toxin-antitoxin system PIN domain toxin
MIAVESNILVYAHRRDAQFHNEAAAQLATLAESSQDWAIPWPCIHEFFAIVTHPRIYRPPSSTDEAITQIEAWLASPNVVLLAESNDHWSTLRSILINRRIVGPMVHDARIAALCAEHGVKELWTADRDFTRLATIRVRNPLIPA